MANICYTGGAVGADSVFEFNSHLNSYEVISYSFHGHKSISKNPIILSDKELDEGFEHIKIANKRLKRNLNNISPYVRKLLSRDWYQVKDTDAVFAIASLATNDTVSGGTGYACSCAVDLKKPVYLFDQIENLWYYYDYHLNRFYQYGKIPTLTEKFTGIGTRDINENGINAIRQLFV